MSTSEATTGDYLPSDDDVWTWMKERDQWRLWSYDSNPPKKPLDENFTGEGWNDPGCWYSYERARQICKNNPRFDGIGFVVSKSDPYYGLDLDGALTEPGELQFKDWVPDIAEFEHTAPIQVSISDLGTHIFGKGSLPDWWSNVEVGDHEGVEAYDEKFFIVTGNQAPTSGTEPPEHDPSEWLLKAYRNITGNLPHIESDESEREYDGNDELPKSEVKAALDHIDPDLSHTEWVRIGYAVHDWDDGSTGKSVFEDWSKGGTKWDRQAQQTIDWIWSQAEQNGGVSVGTLIYKAKKNGYEPPKSDNSGHDDRDGIHPIHSRFIDACQHYNVNESVIGSRVVDGEKIRLGVEDLIPTTGLGDAVMEFNRTAEIDGTDKQAVIGRVVYLDLCEEGEFFKTNDGRLYYYYESENEVYRVDDSGRRELTEDFQGMVWGKYNLFAGRFSRNLGKDLKRQARENAPTKPVYQFAHFDQDSYELYINDWGNGYYAVSPTDIEWRPNGTDVYFLSEEVAEPYEYLTPDERPNLPSQIPGERPTWFGSGDAVMRLFGNRINYDENAALAPAQQRKQLYVHLHTLPFIDVLNARPIMAWVGEKGSGKTTVERSIGRFIYGGDYTESVMPDAKDDFLAKVTNQTLAFLDNYDDGVEWANDVLAAIATGSGIDKRELFTTNTLRQERPRCWLSITSRNPPFRRDDVADRTLVFRVERIEDFLGMGDYLKQVANYRDLLWSVYLDNLKAILAERKTRDTASMSSGHRMADWAKFAKITADALDVDDIDELLETMETERATFALENEPWAAVISDWIENEPSDAATWRKAQSLADRLSDVADKQDRVFSLDARGLGSKLSHYENELAELYNLEIDDSRRTNNYRFEVDSDSSPTQLERF